VRRRTVGEANLRFEREYRNVLLLTSSQVCGPQESQVAVVACPRRGDRRVLRSYFVLQLLSIFLMDRKKNTIISGGTNVFPKDIEEILVQHPAVREVAVFGVPHEKWGETPLAAVVLHGGKSVTEAELRDWTNERVVAKYQRVHAVVITEEFPRSTAGKTLKRVLREPYWKGRESKI